MSWLKRKGFGWQQNELRLKPKVYNQRCLALLQHLHPTAHWSGLKWSPQWWAELGWKAVDGWEKVEGTRNSDKRARWIFNSGGNGGPPEGFVQEKDNLTRDLDRVIWQNVPGELEGWTRDQAPTSLAQVSVCYMDYFGPFYSFISQSINKYF